MRVNLYVARPAKSTPTRRQLMTTRDIDSAFGRGVEIEKKMNTLNEIGTRFDALCDGDEHDRLMQAVGETLTALPMRKKRVAGWCDLNFARIADRVDARNAANDDYARTKSAEAKATLTMRRRELKKAKRKERNLWLLNEASSANASLLPGAHGSKAMWKFAKKVQRGLSKWHDTAEQNVRNKDGVMATTAEGNAENFRAHFANLYKNTSDRAASIKHYERMNARQVDRQWLPPTLHEMMACLKELKDVAPGESGIPGAVWRSFLLDGKLMHVLHRILRTCWESGEVPKGWCKMSMNVLGKNGPGVDMSLMKSYRGIAIAEVLSKVYTSMLKKRLQPLYESVAPEYSCGFRPGRSRNDSVFAVKEQLRKRKEWGLDSYLVLWDVKTCFDVIPKEHIWKSMHLLGVDPKIIAAVKSALKDTTCTMAVDGVTKTANMVDGSGQGTTPGITNGVCELV
jgi:hypothetical protein